MSSPWRLAIDFGTSNTAAAHCGPAREPSTLSLTHQSNLMPSSVFVGADGIVVGLAAFNRAATEPAAFVASPKRYIETDTVTVDGRQVPVVDLVAAVIDHVLGLAARHHDGTAPEQVVLTHPEAWSPAAVSRLAAAGHRAGIPGDRLALVSEPRAAARFYSQHDPTAPGARVAVFDFGGGTLDVAVLESDGEDFRVVGARGDNSLGGRNVDALIRRWVDTQLEDEHPALKDYLDHRASAGVLQALDHSVRSAKEVLSDTSSATVTVATPDGETTLLLTRPEFEQLVDADVQRALDITAAALRDAGTGPDVTTMYLTGGSSRIPYVQDRLGTICRVATLDDPKTVVARGALYAVGAGDDGPPGPGPGPVRADGHAGATDGAAAWSDRSADGSTRPEPAPVGGVANRRRPVVPVAIGVVVLLVLAALIWGARSSLTGDPADEEDKIAVKGLTGAPAEILPNAYLGRLRSCNDPTPTTVIWSEGKVTGSLCSWRDGTDLDDRYDAPITSVSSDGKLSRAIGDTAGPALINGMYAVEVLREAHGSAPLVTLAHAEGASSGFYLAVTYPERSVSFLANSIDSREQAEGLARELGFLD